MTSQGQAIADRWDQAFNGGNLAELGAFYSPNGKVIPAGGTAVSGPEKIQAFFTDLQAKGFNGHKITVQDVISRGDTLVLTGRWELNGPGADRIAGKRIGHLARGGNPVGEHFGRKPARIIVGEKFRFLFVVGQGVGTELVSA